MYRPHGHRELTSAVTVALKPLSNPSVTLCTGPRSHPTVPLTAC
jgi:hypothetical protein